MIVGNFIQIDNRELSPKQWEKLFKQLTFENGDGNVVTCYRQILSRGYTKVPRGVWSMEPVASLDYKDRRVKPKMPKLDFKVELDAVEIDPRFEGQSHAVAKMFEHEQGLIIRPPGTGKTQIALAFAARCETTTLVLVHTKDILKQWLDYAHKALPGVKIGVIQGEKFSVGHITIATVQTIKKFITGDKRIFDRFGCVILDEAHHASASSFEAVLNSCPAYYRFGFTASPTRADGMHPTMKFIIGPIIHRQKFSSTVPLRVHVVKTTFYARYRHRNDWSPLLNSLISDEGRNKQIAGIVDREIKADNSVLVLSRRIEHLELIQQAMKGKSAILTAKIPQKKRNQILHDFKRGKIQCVLSTQLADEALDVPRLNRVLLVHPGKHEGRLIQQIGRALRTHTEKKDAVIYDFVDGRVGVLRRQWSERKRTYRINKISLRRGTPSMVLSALSLLAGLK